ncbi:hypothetical protein BJX66DRAFT_70268 [Aspergillus keveii]|uniref:Uncharacterized protein n=1 Tax=Aspergillus keveii TaxID=714993 RepID=A0ABR4FP90_9EURO
MHNMGDPKPKPFECLKCNTSFRRADHLRRHTRLHARGNQYECYCGRHFSRNDVLRQHLRQCRHSPRDGASRLLSGQKQTRSKSACDLCARSKLKCDSQTPCNNCSRRSVPCKYTREGYSDPYRAFHVASGPESGGSGIDTSAGLTVTQAPPTIDVQDTIRRESELPDAPELQELWGYVELSDVSEYSREPAHPRQWELPGLTQSPEGVGGTHLDLGLLPPPVQSPPTGVDFQHQQSLLAPIDYLIGTTFEPHCDPEILSCATRTDFFVDIPVGKMCRYSSNTRFIRYQ